MAAELIIENPVITQGGTLTVWVQTDYDLAQRKLFFRGRYYPLFSQGDTLWRAFIGTDVTLPPQTYSLFFKGKTKTGKLIRAWRKIWVSKGDFRKSVIRIPKAKKKLAKTAYINREAAIIGRIFRTVSSRQLWKDTFAMPVQGQITTPYGALRIYDNGKLSWWHKGVDIANAKGTPVVAPNAGRVVLSHRFISHGQTIIVDHGQTVFSIFTHLASRSVRKGDVVRKKQLIGTVGSSGIATGPHLHWGLSVSNVRVDPLLWLSKM